MVIDVAKRTFTTPFQFREFIEQAWFITSVTLMPTVLVSIPFGAVISLQVGNLTGQLARPPDDRRSGKRHPAPPLPV